MYLVLIHTGYERHGGETVEAQRADYVPLFGSIGTHKDHRSPYQIQSITMGFCFWQCEHVSR